MRNARIKAKARVNENTSPKNLSKVLYPEKGTHLLFTLPEYLLHNSHIKKLYADEEARVRVFGVLVDEGHAIHEWAEAGVVVNFWNDYRELKTLQVILWNNAPWWALPATFANQIFKTVCETLSFGTSRPFWGIDVGTEPCAICPVRPMESAAGGFQTSTRNHNHVTGTLRLCLVYSPGVGAWIRRLQNNTHEYGDHQVPKAGSDQAGTEIEPITHNSVQFFDATGSPLCGGHRYEPETTEASWMDPILVGRTLEKCRYRLAR